MADKQTRKQWLLARMEYLEDLLEKVVEEIDAIEMCEDTGISDELYTEIKDALGVGK